MKPKLGKGEVVLVKDLPTWSFPYRSIKAERIPVTVKIVMIAYVHYVQILSIYTQELM
jgi:hypothetical protein